MNAAASLGQAKVNSPRIADALAGSIQSEVNPIEVEAEAAKWFIPNTFAKLNRALGKYGVVTPAVGEALVNILLHSTSDYTRTLAANALGVLKLKNEEVLKSLKHSIKEGSNKVRASSIVALGKLGVLEEEEEESLQLLVDSLNDKNTNVRLAAAHVLSDLCNTFERGCKANTQRCIAEKYAHTKYKNSDF